MSCNRRFDPLSLFAEEGSRRVKLPFCDFSSGKRYTDLMMDSPFLTESAPDMQLHAGVSHYRQMENE